MISAAVNKKPGPDASLRKALADPHGKKVFTLGQGPHGRARHARRRPTSTPTWQPWVRGFLFSPALTVGGGTSEVLRNIIAERLLGLPHDHDVEQGMTWEESRHARSDRATGVDAGSRFASVLALALRELHGHVLDAADEVGAQRLHVAGELDASGCGGPSPRTARRSPCGRGWRRGRSAGRRRRRRRARSGERRMSNVNGSSKTSSSRLARDVPDADLVAGLRAAGRRARCPW